MQKELAELPYITDDLKRIEDRAVDQLQPSAIGDFAIVTAIDYSHYYESFDAIASSYLQFPNHTLIVYDLGLERNQVKEVPTTIPNLFLFTT